MFFFFYDVLLLLFYLTIFSGLEDVLQQYVPNFESRGVTGKELLILDYDEMEQLGITKLGHQELMFEAIEHLNKLVG